MRGRLAPFFNLLPFSAPMGHPTATTTLFLIFEIGGNAIMYRFIPKWEARGPHECLVGPGFAADIRPWTPQA